MSIKSKVLFILGTLWGDNGITTHMVTLAKGLMQQGWTVAVATSLASNLEGAQEEATRIIEWFESHGVQYFPISFPELCLTSTNVVNTFKSLSQLDAAIRQCRPQVIHVHSLSVCPQVQLIRLMHRLPLVSTCHLEPDINRLNVKLGGFYNAHFNPTFFGNRVVAVSSELEQAFEQVMQVPRQHIQRIPYGTDNATLRPPSAQERLAARQALNLAPEAKLVCLIGRLSPVKGHDLLFQALAYLQAEGVDAIALCAGKGYGEEEDRIRAQASEAGVADRIRLLGFTDTRQVLWASDVIALPSRRESFGMVISEAMFCGVVPVRTPAAGAFDQIQDGVNGFIVPFEQPQALANRLQQLFENDDLRTRMAAAALEVAQRKFTAARMTQDTIALYNEAIEAIHRPQNA